MKFEGGIDKLSFWENNWLTDMGGWFPGERVVLRGQDMFSELKDLTWMGQLMLGICGRQFDEKQVQLFDGIWRISTSFPDPRLWNNRIAALAVSARSTSNLGVSAGLAVSEATIYGHRPLLATMKFLCSTQELLERGEPLASILIERLNIQVNGRPGSGKNRQVAKIPGFGRPITKQDERVIPLLEFAETLGFSDGVYVRLANDIESMLQSFGHNLRMNISMLMGAMCADQGLTPRQYYHYITLCFSAGIMFCARDAEKKPEGSFFPHRCECIDYQGPGMRDWE